MGENAGEFKMLGQPDAKPNKPIKIRKNSSVTFNVAFYPNTAGVKRAKLEAVSGKKKKDQTVSVELYGLGITYEGGDITGVSKLLDSVKDGVKEITNTKAILKVYPNPSPLGSKIYLDLAEFGKQEPVTLSLYDTFGQLYQAKTVITDAQGSISTEMPVVKAMKPGIYIIKASTPSGQKQTKIVLE